MSDDSPPPSDEPAAEESVDDPLTASRRTTAKWLLGIGGAVSIVGVVVDAVWGLPGEVNSGPEQFYVEGTFLVDQDGNRLGLDALPAGSGEELTAFPEKEGGGAVTAKDATTALLRFGADSYEDPTNTDWTPKGYVAYSKVCTHEGCLVSGRKGDALHCPCHDTTFDPLKGAEVTGGPAPRALPQLPIAVSEEQDSLLIATGAFEGPVGPK
ncbi:MAG: ubiquinol-cytochrome c reductase iron-sulfur subunit [Haloarculaceae archaeon]